MLEEPRGFAEGERIAKVSVWTLLGLGIVEIAFSLVTLSVALLADGIDSLGDAGVTFFVWTGLRFVRRRPSRRFQFGYYKVESFTAFVTGIVLIPISAYILLRSYRALLSPVSLQYPLLALGVLVAAGLGSLYRALQMRRIANKYNILSLKLDAKNSIKDTTSSFVAFVSVLLTQFGIFHADAIGGMLVAVYILSVAYVTIKESSLVLLDEFHEPELSKQIESVIRSHGHVMGIRDLRLRRAGPFVVGALEVEVDGSIPLNMAHEVATQIETSVKASIKGIRRFVVTPVPHMDPHQHPHDHLSGR
ncbi:MAG TPA: cation diffusion facilitator family transporter [Candidatus Dormibacteraeota bacterium]|jgi:cation diffusion facilitator family transporter|nr:cation diffusion facilitator family transporter [Candidatus Dormibacteraeota bacterium]